MLSTEENFINPCFAIRASRQHLVFIVILKLDVAKAIISPLEERSLGGEVKEEWGR